MHWRSCCYVALISQIFLATGCSPAPRISPRPTDASVGDARDAQAPAPDRSIPMGDVIDLRFTDQDGDAISDLYEGLTLGVDSDRDDLPDARDPDSDGDGLQDSEEGGTTLGEPPRDTDLDGLPDFRDTDSDDDGISDRDEVANGSAPRSADTDGDGIPDPVELFACAMDAPNYEECRNDITNPGASPRSRGGFFFLVPYEMPNNPDRDTLSFETTLQVADVYFLMDTTGSMAPAINDLKASLSTSGSGLIDRVRTLIPDVWFGVGGFEDYGDGDQAYYHLQDLTNDIAAAQAAVNLYTTRGGGDLAESSGPALWATVTGNGLDGESRWTGHRRDGYTDPSRSTRFEPCPEGTMGWPCFRNNAVRVIVAITDAPIHNGPRSEFNYTDGRGPHYSETVTALHDARAKVIGIAVTASRVDGQRQDLEQVARDTNTVDGTGAPLVSEWNGSGLSDAVVDQIRVMARQTPIDVSARFEDDPSDAIETNTAFLSRLEANSIGDVTRRCDPRPAVDTNSDGVPDTFRRVTPGNPVCFDIVVKRNTTVQPTREPQIFRASVSVVGDGFTPLDRRDVYFLVPARVPPPPGIL